MYNRFDFFSIEQYDNYVIDINEKDYKKMLKSIKKLEEYDYSSSNFYTVILFLSNDFIV